MQDISISSQPFLYVLGLVSSAIADSTNGNLTGAVDPNGVVAGRLGQIYTQVVGSVTTIWVNTDGATAWS